MAKVRVMMLICTLTLFLNVTVSASDFEIFKIDFSSMRWGDQKITINLSNLSEDYKFVVAESRVGFLDTVFVSPRSVRNSFILEPMSSASLDLPLEIPGNFGTALVSISLYDVVDTLDQPLESQRFHTEEHKIVFEIPERLKPIIDSGIQVPVFVDRITLFDNLLSRVFVVLLHRSKTLAEIASICNTEPNSVRSIASHLEKHGYLESAGSEFKSNFIVIESDKIDFLRPAIGFAVDNLYKVITENLPAYDSSIKALADAGKLTKDANDLFDGGSVLYHRYPVVLGLLLWDILGRDFVNDGMKFSLFEESGSSYVSMGDFMHMAVGKADRNGRTFYHYVQDPDGEAFYCGDVGSMSLPDRDSDATGNFPVSLLFRSDPPPLYLSYNEDKLRIPLSILMDGASEFTVRLKGEVESTFSGENEHRFIRGARYWCWNLVVTELIDKFESNNILEKESGGVYVFQKVDY